MLRTASVGGQRGDSRFLDSCRAVGISLVENAPLVSWRAGRTRGSWRARSRRSPSPRWEFGEQQLFPRQRVESSGCHRVGLPARCGCITSLIFVDDLDCCTLRQSRRPAAAPGLARDSLIDTGCTFGTDLGWKLKVLKGCTQRQSRRPAAAFGFAPPTASSTLAGLATQPLRATSPPTELEAFGFHSRLYLQILRMTEKGVLLQMSNSGRS